MRRRKRRPQPLPTNQFEQFYCQPLGQEKGDYLSNLNSHRGYGVRKIITVIMVMCVTHVLKDF